MDEVMKRSVKALLIFCMTLLSIQARGGDPDFKREEYFHSIYKKYNEQPTSPEAWEKVLSNRKINSYTVQKNDTLWDVSQTFFGDSNYWPKVWSYNTEGILNPHEINPGNNIRFYTGTFEEPPMVGLASKDTPPESAPEKIIEKHVDGTVEAVKIPPPKRQSRPVVKNLPKSLPLYRLGAVNTAPIEFESKSLPKIQPAQRYLTIYAVEQEVESVGEIVEIEVTDSQTASEFQYVTVRLTNASHSQLVAYDDSNRVKDPLSSSEATLIEIQGELEPMERVNDSENLFRALVKKSVAPVRKGAKLMPGMMKKFEVKSAPPTTSVQARIIGGEPQKYQKLFGEDEFIFLSAGAKDGVQEESVLQVYLNGKVRNEDTKTLLNDRAIGLIKILKTSDHFSTAYILNSKTNFEIGDYAGGQVKAMASDENSRVEGSAKADPDLNLDTLDEAPAPAPASEADDLQL
ncbi:MAG: LysM peptidoglycan-binding domain-containing protein [Bdellovibrionaceae bacterium]|nr:LysM peptidoglycan-binding domain-containing protein [Pseudobdellovibrionaceae bacterium]